MVVFWRYSWIWLFEAWNKSCRFNQWQSRWDWTNFLYLLTQYLKWKRKKTLKFVWRYVNSEVVFVLVFLSQITQARCSEEGSIGWLCWWCPRVWWCGAKDWKGCRKLFWSIIDFIVVHHSLGCECDDYCCYSVCYTVCTYVDSTNDLFFVQ